MLQDSLYSLGKVLVLSFLILPTGIKDTQENDIGMPRTS